jgi:uncharacterized protein YndB with AHSA1/START domain
MKDLIEELQAARRRVGTTSLPAGEAHVVTVQRTYPAAIDDVWDAVTTKERIARWFLPVTGDLRKGGRYQLEGNAGGEIRDCEPPERLAVTWEVGDVDPDAGDASLVTLTLTALDDDLTELTLEHAAVVPPEFWDGYGPGAVGVGWDMALLGLVAHLEGVDLGPPEELERSPEMRESMQVSSEAWGRAATESGEEAHIAGRRVAATTTFYVPPEG